METDIEQIQRLSAEKASLERDQKLFKALVESAVGDIGESFFNNIVTRLAEWLNANCVIIGQVRENKIVDAVPMYMDGKIIHGYSYCLDDTPCDLTSKKGFCFYPENIAKEFPKDKDLVDLKAESYIGTALYNTKGNPTGVLCAISRNKMDLPSNAKDIMRIVGARITAEIERKKTLIALEQSEKELKKSNALKDRIFSILSHDLKSPFSNIMSISQVLKNDLLQKNYDDVIEQVNVVIKSSNQSYALLQNLLDWSISQIKGKTFHQETLILKNICDSVTEKIHGTADHKKITVNNHINPEIIAFADSNMVETILRNLIGNAIKYTNTSGNIDISAEIEQEQIKVIVKDDGTGIKNNIIDKLFDIQSGVSTPGTANEHGTGLGLMICKEFVEQHGGNIWIESEYGTGTKVCFLLPNGKSS